MSRLTMNLSYFVGASTLTSSGYPLSLGSLAASGCALSWYCEHVTTQPVFNDMPLLVTTAIVDGYASETNAESYERY